MRSKIEVLGDEGKIVKRDGSIVVVFKNLSKGSVSTSRCNATGAEIKKVDERDYIEYTAEMLLGEGRNRLVTQFMHLSDARKVEGMREKFRGFSPQTLTA